MIQPNSLVGCNQHVLSFSFVLLLIFLFSYVYNYRPQLNTLIGTKQTSCSFCRRIFYGIFLLLFMFSVTNPQLENFFDFLLMATFLMIAIDMSHRKSAVSFSHVFRGFLLPVILCLQRILRKRRRRLRYRKFYLRYRIGRWQQAYHHRPQWRTHRCWQWREK